MIWVASPFAAWAGKYPSICDAVRMHLHQLNSRASFGALLWSLMPAQLHSAEDQNFSRSMPRLALGVFYILTRRKLIHLLEVLADFCAMSSVGANMAGFLLKQCGTSDNLVPFPPCMIKDCTSFVQQSYAVCVKAAILAPSYRLLPYF